MAEPFERRATRLVADLRSLVRLWRWGPRERVLAVAGLAALAAALCLSRLLAHLPKEWQATVAPGWRFWLPAPLWASALVCLGLAAWRILRAVASPLPEEEPQLALKGAASFTPEDSELFAQLGRGADIEQLRAWILDDQKPLLVLMGESGVGKTSLLRAGIAHALHKDALETIYWEALPSDAAAGLLHALRTGWGKAKGAPADLEALPAAIASSPRVVLLDQFEQLSPEAHPEIFDLLRQALLTPPPYLGTWIVAFRREYSATWVDFTLSLPESARHRIETLSLNRFSVATSRRIVAVLATAAQLPIDHQILDAVVDGLAVAGRVSPVDLGVTLLGLGELARPGETSRVSLDNFRTGGGPAGLLTRYLERQLALFSPPERKEVLAALLALVDLGSNQRRSEGLFLEELVARAHPTSPTRFAEALRFLASGKVRVLEPPPGLEGTPGYRLLHDRFAEPVRILNGSLLDQAALAALRLDEAYRSWSKDRRPRYLLSGAELRSVLRYQGQFSWGEDETGKRGFLRRSQWHRATVRALALAVCLSALGFAAAARHWLARQELRTNLRSYDLPEYLASSLPQLDILEVGSKVTHLDWLERASHLKSLTILSDSETLDGLPPTLTDLTCDCPNLQHNQPFPPSLRKLNLVAEGNRVESLPSLPPSLESLTYKYPIEADDQPRRASALPPNLKSLVYEGMNLPGFLLPLPRRLQSLTLRLSSMRGVLGALPPALRQLKVAFKVGVGQSDQLIGKLPASLQEVAVNVSGLANQRLVPPAVTFLNLQINADELLPKPSLDLRNLTALRKLDLTVSASFRTPQRFEPMEVELPGTLRSLAYTGGYVRIDSLPSDLESLTILGPSYFLPPPVGLQTRGFEPRRLPGSLKSLYLDSCLATSWKGLPSSVHSLALSRCPRPSDLPANLLSLTLYATPLPLKLPPHLRHLTYYGPWRDLAGRLPPSLRSLRLGQQARLEELTALPPQLEELSIPGSANVTSLPKSVRILRLLSPRAGHFL
jgi:hypothetical protein